MSKSKVVSYGPIVIAAGFFFVILLPAVIWFQFIRDEYSNKMLAEVNDQLLKHELSWAGRGRDYAQYTVTCFGKEKSCQMLYRIPATTNRVPALVIIHDMGGPERVFEMLDEAGNSGQCAIATISLDEYFEREPQGRIEMKNSVFGKGMMDGLDAVDLAIEFLKGHNLVDTTAIYVVGIGEGGVLAIPAAVNYKTSLKGVVSIDASAMMSLKEWDENDFASPIGWAKKLSPLTELLVSTGGEANAMFASAFADAEQIQASSPNVQEKYSVAIGTTIDWVWKDRPRSEETEPEFEPPTPDKTVMIRK